MFFRILFLVLPTVILSSCISLQQSGSPHTDIKIDTGSQSQFSPTPTYSDSGVLQFSGTGNIQLSSVLDSQFRVLESEKKAFSVTSLRDEMSGYSGAVIYFYPKDGTPNCTIQALDFSLMIADFRAHGYQVIGVSKDSIDSHKIFAERNDLKIPLIEDGSGVLLRAFGAEGPLQTYGNGDALSDIVRSTYVIDAHGNPKYAFRDVVAKGHARRIYELVTGQKYTK